MTEYQHRLSELMFTAFTLSLFERCHNPANTFAWFKATCLLLHIDPDPMQRLLLNIMSGKSVLREVVDELAYLLFAKNHSLHGIIKMAVRSRAQTYRRIKLYRVKGYIPQPLRFNEDEARYAAEFLKAFEPIGGIFA